VFCSTFVPRVVPRFLKNDRLLRASSHACRDKCACAAPTKTGGWHSISANLGQDSFAVGANKSRRKSAGPDGNGWLPQADFPLLIAVRRLRSLPCATTRSGVDIGLNSRDPRLLDLNSSYQKRLLRGLLPTGHVVKNNSPGSRSPFTPRVKSGNPAPP
jgi:hypothetical protein